MPKITNISPGPRGVNTEDGVVFLQPGQSRDDLKVSDAELKSLSEDWFRVGRTAKADVDSATEAEVAAKAEAERKAKAEAAAKAGQ
ncbi:hypothetical protein [Caulobacter sp. RHG1]|uniref:hypothetical protein n=1 Tax=Caulobacter sp. (strain RHG1) TaxID=2545762 RepID=UPI0015561277|nr:hypothetical protein [Caulobacter sp. RHG1]NQE62950.1 hypothetical protein [Caulobacter sp. RHG1]